MAAAVSVPTLTGGAVERVRRSGMLDLLLAVGVLLSLGRFLATALGYGIPAWFSEELPPLIGLLAHGEPITAIDVRQYGVVTFLVYDPAVRLLGPDLHPLAAYGLVVSLVASLAALILIARHLFAGHRRDALVLALLWLNFVPLLYVVAQRMVDAWQLLFLSAAFVLFSNSSASPRWRRLAGVPLALAAMTKILPALLLVYLFIRDWRAGVLGLAVVGALLGVGQALYGTLMGFGYPAWLLSSGGGTVAAWSTHYENNSLRGLIYKAAAGFRLEPDTKTYVLAAEWQPFLNALSYALAFALVGYLLLVAWRSRSAASPRRRAIELGLAFVTMLLVSPHTAHDYTVVMLPVIALWIALWRCGAPRAWARPLVVASALSAFLIGVFLPMSVMARLIPIDALLAATHNAANVYFAGDPIGRGIGAYDFLGFPGVGLLLAWGVMAVLEYQSRRAVPESAGVPLADTVRPEVAVLGST